MIPAALLWLAGKTKIPAGLIAGALVLALMVGVWFAGKSVHDGIYNAGYQAAEAVWIKKALDAKIKKLEQELEAARRSKESDDRHDAELEAEREKLKDKVTAYEEELKKRGDHCLLGDDAGKLQ
jgi:septal ring factor EnvC (AmiA/AmiB activator)